MGKLLQYDNNYMYFFHGTNSDNRNSFFNSGLMIDRRGGNNLSYTIAPYLPGKMGDDIILAMSKYATERGYTNCVLVKLPLAILGSSNNMPLPVLKKNYQGVFFLTPHLVAGMYLAKQKKFVRNPNYSLNFSPNGLCYALGQLQFLKSDSELYRIAQEREEMSYEELRKKDRKEGTFAKLRSKYSQKIR